MADKKHRSNLLNRLCSVLHSRKAFGIIRASSGGILCSGSYYDRITAYLSASNVSYDRFVGKSKSLLAHLNVDSTYEIENAESVSA